MKKQSETPQWLRPALAGLGLAASTVLGTAASDLVLGTFDSDVAGWGTAWGNATAMHDPMMDNTGNGGGACYIMADFSMDQNTLTIYGCNEGNPWWHPTSASFNLSDYKSVEFDIRWDSNAGMSVADFNTPPEGGEGGIVIWAVDYSAFETRPTLGTIQVPEEAANDWVHISVPIDPTLSGIDPSKGIVLKKWITEAQKNVGGTYGFWVDNVTLKGSDAPLPPPSLSLDTPVPGLAFVAASGGQWDRQNIRTVGTGYSWVGASAPVSYSLTVAEFPEGTYSGFQLHMYFVPGTPDATRADPDWHEPNVFFWNVGSNPDGTAYSALHYKTNAPDDNGIFFSDGNFDGAGSGSVNGTWTIVFENNTSVTTIAPNGTNVTVTLPEEVVPYFDSTMQIYVGIVPGDLARVGQMAVLSGVKFSGMPGAAALESNFAGQSLDTNVWEIVAASGFGVQEIPDDARFWVDWTLPALDFVLEGSTSVAGGWSSPAPTGFDIAGKHRVLLCAEDMPGSNAAFWRLIKRPFTKLQILLPGETAAPGTATGKTGTPIAQAAGVEFQVTVNAVDDNWNLASAGRDTINLTTTDEFSPMPADAALVNGTRTFTVMFNSPGSWTITATDVTDSAKPATTSSAVTVQ